MTATGVSLLKHPDKDDIDERLLSGESVEAVAGWLRRKYASYSDKRKKKLCPNKMTLQGYRKNFLKLESEAIKDLRNERKARVEEAKKQKAIEGVRASANYQIAKKKYAEGCVRTVEQHEEGLQLIYTKIMERIAIMETQKVHHLNDKVICDYLNTMRQTIREYFDMQRQLTEDKETNITVDVKRFMKEYRILQSVVQEVIMEVSPELQSVFITKLEEKISNANLDDYDDDEGPASVNINIKG